MAESRDFCQFFCFKGSTWAPYEQTKTVSRAFRFREDIRILSPKIRICAVLVCGESIFFLQASPLKSFKKMLGFIEIGTKGWHLINFQKNLLIKK